MIKSILIKSALCHTKAVGIFILTYKLTLRAGGDGGAGRVFALPLFFVVHKGNNVAMIFIRDSDVG